MARSKKRHHRHEPGHIEPGWGSEFRFPPGTPPGTIRVAADAPQPVVTAIAFGPDSLEEHVVTDLSGIRALRQRHAITWIDVQGLGDATTIEAIGAEFGLHRLSLEDTVNVHQRAKIELYPGNLYFVARAPEQCAGERGLGTDQLSLFLGADFVVTFQEKPGDCFGPVRERLRRAGPIRRQGPDYLAYALIDAVVDGWFPVLEDFGERLEALEDEILARPVRRTMNEVHALRRELLALRRSVWPLRDALGALFREQTPLVRDETRVFIRDCYDHSVQILDLVENARETAAQLGDLYLSTVSNRMNEIMKVLTVISTIFLPLSFIAGVYGMNFEHMPELTWPRGYAFALGLMLLTALAMLGYFWRKGWMRSLEDDHRHR